MRNMTTLLVIGCLAGICLCPTREARAGLSVSPGIIEIMASRGDEASGVCTVTNTGQEKIRVTAEPEDWRKGLRGERGGKVSDWLTIAPMTAEVAPGKSGEFSYHIKVAGDAAGEHTAQIFFTESSPAAGGTQIQTRIGTILYVAVRETARPEAEISDLKVSVAREGSMSVASAQVTATNNGNVHIRPNGDVKLYDAKGKCVLAVVLSTGWGILPGESYVYYGNGRGPSLAPGRYKAVATIDYGKLYKQDKTYQKELYVQVDSTGNVPQTLKAAGK